MNEHLDVTNDLVFQRIFGKVGNEQITKNFLEKLLGTKIESLSLDTNKRLIGEFVDDKIGRLDVKAKLNNGTRVIIEMQVSKYKYMPERLLYYWSEAYSKDLKRGKSYDDLHKTIAVLISTQGLEQLQGIEDYHTTWHLREDRHLDTKLTSFLEIHIIELNKFKEGKENPDNDWIKFILGGSMSKKEEFEREVQEAIEELEILEQDPEMQELYRLKEKALRDKISFMKEAERIATETGYKNGMEAGMEAGMKARNGGTEKKSGMEVRN